MVIIMVVVLVLPVLPLALSTFLLRVIHEGPFEPKAAGAQRLESQCEARVCRLAEPKPLVPPSPTRDSNHNLHVIVIVLALACLGRLGHVGDSL